MSAPARPHARDVFNDALERPVGEREAFVAAACADDAALRQDVHALLHAHVQAERALEPASTVVDPAAPGNRLIGTRIGGYHVRRLIAAGGMGAVYEATQEQPRRIVALKLLRHGIASRSALRRFEYETQILARLRHPGIAQIYEAGTHDDGTGAIPYFAMEYIPAAASLTDFARSRALDTRQRLELFAEVCDAVHHGHQKGIIHRDLKPSNILVDSGGAAKVIDFGVARATDSDLAVTTLQTDMGQLIGTVQYMSPEQCTADPHDIDTRSDVYSMGVVLYELLCDRLPYDLSHVALHEATRVIREQPPPRPSTIDRVLRGDVETIVLKALEKDRARRYQSAGDLGEDIRRLLRHDPILARPPSVMYQIRTFARRNRAVFGALAALFGLMAIASIVVSILWLMAVRARAAEERIAADAIDLFRDQLMGSVQIADRGQDEQLARDVIEAAQRHLASKFANRPDVQITALRTLADAYRVISDFESAERQVLQAMAIAVPVFGEDHNRTLHLWGMLAALSRDQADHRRAEEIYVDMLARMRKTGSYTTAPWESLSDMYLDLGRCADAERVLLEAIDFYGQPEHGVLASAYYLTNLGGVYRTQCRLDEAEGVIQDALNRFTEAAHLSAAESFGGYRTVREMARLRMVQGRHDEARALQQQALEGMARTSSRDEYASLDSILCVELGGLIDLQQGRIDEAQKQFVEAIDRASSSFNSEHEWWTAHFQVDLARCLMLRQQFDEAERLLRPALVELRTRLGDEHHRTQNGMRTLAELLGKTRRADEAAEFLTRCRAQPCR